MSTTNMKQESKEAIETSSKLAPVAHAHPANDGMIQDMSFFERVKYTYSSMTFGSKLSVFLVALLFGLSVATTTQGPPASNLTPSPDLDTGDTAWLLSATALVLLMTPGLAFFYGGMVDRRNILYTMFQSISAIALITCLWTFIGFSLAWGDDVGGIGLIGNPATYFFYRNVGAEPHPDLCPTVPLGLFSLFHLKFAIITPPIIAGAFTDRIAYVPYCIFILCFSILVYCPMVHSIWHPDGFLHKAGVLDFAGGTVVETASGYAGLAGSIVFNMHSVEHSGGVRHNPHIPFIVLGTSILWFGWFGFNAGSSYKADGIAVQSFINTNCAACIALLTWLLVDKIRGLRPSVTAACVGAVVGLVAITPACGYVSVGGAFIVGLVAAVICNIACQLVKESDNLDDELEVFPAHGLGGTVGLILTGVLANKDVNPAGEWGLIYGEYHAFTWNLIAAFGCAAYSFCVAFILFRIIGHFMPLSPKPYKRAMGLDQSFHGESVVLTEGPLAGRSSNSIANMGPDILKMLQEDMREADKDDLEGGVDPSTM